MAIGCIDGPHHHLRCVPYRLKPFVRINRRGLGFRHQRSAILRELSVHGANAIQDSMQGRLFVSAILIGCLPVIRYLAGPKFLYTRCEPKSPKWTDELRKPKERSYFINTTTT